MFREGEIWYISDIGAIFCQVSRSIPDVSGIPWVTSGTQKWNGASPSLIARASVMMMEEVWSEIWDNVHWFVIQALLMMANMSIMEAVDCVRKYLMADSVARGWLGYVIMGIIANVLISRPIQATSQ